MARFLGGFLAVLVLVCCIAAGAMGGCTVGMPLMIQSGSSNIGGMLFAGVICVGVAVGLYFGIRAAKAVFRSISNPQSPAPSSPGPREEDER